MSLGSTDDVSLRSERRHVPVLRLAHVEHDDDAWDLALAESWKNGVLGAFERNLALDALERSPTRIVLASALSARGPPSLRV